MVKGQAAMEFLMTYGIAIAIIIGVVIALYSMGILKFPSGGGAKCNPCFPPGSAVAYVDHNADTLVVKVGPYKINDTRVIVGGSVVDTEPGPFETGNTITYSSTGSFKGDVDVTIEYRVVESGLLHNTTATLHGA